jgi:hypothetical protein
VFLLGVENLLPEVGLPGPTDEGGGEHREENARKLYMAMTRAAHRLILVSSRRLPASIERQFEVSGEATR